MSFDPIAPHETDYGSVGVIKLDHVATTSTVDTAVVPLDPGLPVDPGEPIGGGGGSGGSGGGGHPGSIEAIDPIKIVEALKSIPWGQAGITLNELALKATSGYNGEKIDTNKLTAIASANGVAIYAGANGAMYGDRDGNGVIDTGILYNPSSGIVSADFGCDGVGDQVIAVL